MQKERSLSATSKSAGCRPKLLQRLAAAAIAVAACGCATDGPRNPEGAPVPNVLVALERGEIRLTCGASCAGYYGAFRKQQRARYDRHQWKDLALDVARIGYRINQSYFYLGRAAEGLGHVEAARTYYELAIASPMKCGRVFDTCDGLVFPDDALSRLRDLPPR
jgi:hypothetical protein